MKCRSASIPVDGEWDKLDRKGVCLNDKIVKVKITDTCAFPLQNPATPQASKRAYAGGGSTAVDSCTSRATAC